MSGSIDKKKPWNFQRNLKSLKNLASSIFNHFLSQRRKRDLLRYPASLCFLNLSPTNPIKNRRLSVIYMPSYSNYWGTDVVIDYHLLKSFRIVKNFCLSKSFSYPQVTP